MELAHALTTHEYEDEYINSAATVEPEVDLEDSAAKRRRVVASPVQRQSIPPVYSDRETICGKKVWSPEDDAKLLDLVDSIGRHEDAVSLSGHLHC